MSIHSKHAFLCSKKINLLNLNYCQLKKFMQNLGEKPFRAIQIMQWIYRYFCTDFYKMTNLNKTLQMKLNQHAYIASPVFLNPQYSCDGTIKWTVEIKSKFFETVYIPEKNRATLCVSSQFGCALKCHFCATGKIGFQGNLNLSEIIGQLWNVSKILNLKNSNKFPKITNVVFMGMGEPLLNFNNVVSALEIMLDKNGFQLSKNHLTISTAGIVPALNKLSQVIDISLAISLHAPNNQLRNLLMPINKKYNIDLLLNAVKQYLKKSTANRGYVTIEYVMLNNINDTLEHAKELVKLLKNIPNKVNLIPWNNFIGSNYVCSSKIKIIKFSKFLKDHGIFNTIRKNRGQDIYGACGQLIGQKNF
ncbi:Dual-specificity RNA methyltransferase RlmN [Buchnera aphidicola (Eriosoma grossulariae)]|uniref:23S rRNA (adenine(2503)-C(2))-methyltransferase RlmN n=1 Tax=Buchnera aphidicola TaxID=9 RepID=UPI00346428BA